MNYCPKCGARVEDNAKFCPQCGAEMPVFQQYNYSENTYSQSTSHHSAEYFNAQEVKKNKGMGVLSYLGILVLIPILSGDKTSEYVALHMNQGVLLYAISSVAGLLNGAWLYNIPFFPYIMASIVSWVLSVVSFACFVLVIMGIVSACKGTRKRLPIIGDIILFKR